VQETYARWYAMSRPQQDAIESPGGWLTTVASRICLNLLGSARARRERYVGEWIPEPLPEPTEWMSGRPGGTTADPADRVTLDESVAMAFLVVLESMTPAERVAFILHDVFGYSFAEVGEIAGRTPAACRQLASSARRRIRASQPPATPTARQAGIVRDLRQAWEAKDINALIGLLDPHATVIADGGGLASAALRPIQGGAQIARYVVDIAGRAGSLGSAWNAAGSGAGTPGLTYRSATRPRPTPTPTSTGRPLARLWSRRRRRRGVRRSPSLSGSRATTASASPAATPRVSRSRCVSCSCT